MNETFEDITHICDPVMRSLYILYYRLRKRKLHSRFVVWGVFSVSRRKIKLSETEIGPFYVKFCTDAYDV